MKSFFKALTDPLGVIGALLFVALIGCSQQIDRRDELLQVKRIDSERKAEAKKEKRERTAQAMCNSEQGPHVLAVWANNATVECLNQRGRRLASYSMEVSHAE